MGTTKPITSQLPIPKSEISNIIRANTAQLWKERWAKQLKSKTMEYLLPDIETKLPNQIMKLCGYDMSIAIQYLSGHNFLFFGFIITPCNVLEATSDSADFRKASEATSPTPTTWRTQPSSPMSWRQQTTLPRPLTSDLTYPKPSSESADIRPTTLSSSEQHLSGSDRHGNDGLRR